MVASASRAPRGLRAPFALGILMLLLLPSEVGYQDLAALMADQPPLVDRTLKAAFASTFGTIHAAKFSMPRLLGAMIEPPPEYALASFDSRFIEPAGSLRERWLGDAAMEVAPQALGNISFGDGNGAVGGRRTSNEGTTGLKRRRDSFWRPRH